MSWIILIILFFIFLLIIIPSINKKLYKPSNIWNISLFKFFLSDELFNNNYQIPIKQFSPQNKINFSFYQNTGYADPFIFSTNGAMYIFYEYEIREDNSPRKSTINVFRSYDGKKWEDLGCVLSEPFHLSYPYVFKYENDYYMMPETSDLNEIVVYKSQNFPYNWVKYKTLLKDNFYVDSSIIKYNDLYYLFTTIWKGEKQGLYIYVSDNIFGNYKVHPKSPISVTKENMRCGGSIILYRDKLYRPAQYCKNYYGENLALYKVNKLTETEYEETFEQFMNSREYNWSKYGGHHFSLCEFDNNFFVVMDGKVKDNFINNRTRKFFEYFHCL